MDFDTKKLHTQLHGSFRDMVRYEQAERKRRLFLLLDFVAFLCMAIGAYLLYAGVYTYGAVLVGIAVLIIAFFVLRRRKPRQQFNRRRQKRFGRHRRR